ncbi:DegV family protein [Bacillus sp. FJAT-52991]|uniref:DegV family protein n=1 Tax=Bacillus kandeliae TaxID=3129297 RepID=A0ABZ2N4P4_9BACI
MTKKKIAWVTDSTTFVTEKLRNHPDVYVVPLSIIFGEEAFEDGVTLSTDELYKRIKAEKEIPKTSQPPVGVFASLFEKLKEEYECAIAVHVSSKLSGTYATSKAGAELAGLDIHMVDSKSMSYAITSLIYKGMAYADEQMDPKTIAEKLDAETVKSQNLVLLGSLEQFYKGGRMSGTSYLLGTVLQIKPIICVNTDGVFELCEKVRSEKKATKRVIDIVKEAYNKYLIKEIRIMHGNVLEKAQHFQQLLEQEFPNMKFVIGEISSTIAVHAGEGTVALIWENE